LTRGNRRPIQPTIRSHGADTNSASNTEDQFREALACWASGVAILAASDGEEVDALTVSAFSALSADPPLVMVSVGEQASILPMLLEQQRFTISILAAGQRATAGAIAQRLPGSEEVFDSLEDPAVKGALVVLDCALWNAYEGGDHRIVVGRVERISFGEAMDPLLYYRREYRELR
jgi:flavin reductase (NADH)